VHTVADQQVSFPSFRGVKLHLCGTAVSVAAWSVLGVTNEYGAMQEGELTDKRPKYSTG